METKEEIKPETRTEQVFEVKGHDLRGAVVDALVIRAYDDQEARNKFLDIRHNKSQDVAFCSTRWCYEWVA